MKIFPYATIHWKEDRDKTTLIQENKHSEKERQSTGVTGKETNTC